MVAIALAIGCEGPGSILVWQHRIGSDGQLFNALRFRTSPASPAGIEWFLPAQRTRVGEVLWRTHLDGLPMVINVLRGEMTILGSKRARLLG
jgi:lipopolysaccharide/colanic/teichoic acid biosynthesis glycosyltransferase